MLCDGKLSLRWRENLDADNHCILGQKVFNQLWPLYKAKVSRIEILLITHIEDLLDAVDAIKVEVVDRLTLGSVVLVDECEGWTCDGIGRAEMLHNCANKCGFAGTHRATKRHNIATVERLYNRLGNLFQTIK